MKTAIFKHCQKLFPKWKELSEADFDFDDPKGFSSFTIGIRAKVETDPSAVLYRRLEGKENAILDFETEKEVFLLLGDHKIAAQCYYYDKFHRFERFYQGRTLLAEELSDPENLRQIANALFRFHQLRPASLPETPFFDLLHDKWGRLAAYVLNEKRASFPANEQVMCKDLMEILQPETLEKVKKCIPQDALAFCHNDTYHGNIMKLDSGEIKLLDFEFSCLNYKTYDFSNLFAETTLLHKQPEYPYFKLIEPKFTDHELALLINFYLDNQVFQSTRARDHQFQKLLQETKKMILLSDYKYAMAAITLAVEPIQKIRFIPYAHQRFERFIKAYNDQHSP